MKRARPAAATRAALTGPLMEAAPVNRTGPVAVAEAVCMTMVLEALVLVAATGAELDALMLEETADAATELEEATGADAELEALTLEAEAEAGAEAEAEAEAEPKVEAEAEAEATAEAELDALAEEVMMLHTVAGAWIWPSPIWVILTSQERVEEEVKEAMTETVVLWLVVAGAEALTTDAAEVEDAEALKTWQ